MSADFRRLATGLVQHRRAGERHCQATRVDESMGQIDRILSRPKRGVREPKMPVDMSPIGTAEDVNVDAARQGIGGIAGLHDLCAADLQVFARRSVLALVE